MKQTLGGPNSRVTVYGMPFNEKNLKTLFEKRIDDNILFVVKDSRMAREVRDATESPQRPWNNDQAIRLPL
jgi:hypothetical protein